MSKFTFYHRPNYGFYREQYCKTYAPLSRAFMRHLMTFHLNKFASDELVWFVSTVQFSINVLQVSCKQCYQMAAEFVRNLAIYSN